MSANLNWIDFTMLAVISLSAVVGLLRGLVKEALSLVTWLAAFFLAISFSSGLAEQLTPYISHNVLRYGLSFVSIFVAILLIGGLVTWLIKKGIDKSGLTLGDRLLGFIFGFLRGGLFVLLLVMMGVVTAMTHLSSWQESQLIPYALPLAKKIQGFIPESVNDYIQQSDLTFQNHSPENRRHQQ